MIKKMNSNSMEHVQKQHFSFNSRKGNSPSELSLVSHTICSRTVVFWANFMTEQWQITHKLILKSISLNTHCIVDPFTKIKSAGHMAKFNIKSISNRDTFCGFSFTSKCRKHTWNRYKHKNSLLKTYLPRPYSTECTWSFFKNLNA